MGYINQNLSPGESLEHSTKLHWIVFIRPAIVSSFFLIVIIAGRLNNTSELAALGMFGFLIGIGMFLAPVIAYLTSEFGVTSKRLIVKTGFISRNTNESLISKVESVMVDQGVLGRILNYGTVVVVGTGGNRNRYKFIKNPMDLRNKINLLIENQTTSHKAA